MQDPKKSPKITIWTPFHNFVELYLHNEGMYRQSEKNLLSSNTSPTCPHNMVNFGPLAAEIVSLVWDTPGNFNGFHVLAALLHGTLVVGVSRTASLNRGCHLYSAGRPSRWALAHISSWKFEPGWLRTHSSVSLFYQMFVYYIFLSLHLSQLWSTCICCGTVFFFMSICESGILCQNGRPITNQSLWYYSWGTLGFDIQRPA